MPTLETKEKDLKLFEEALSVEKEEKELVHGFDTKEILKDIKAKEDSLKMIKENYDFQVEYHENKRNYLHDKNKRLLGLFLKTDYFKFMVLEAFRNEMVDSITRSSIGSVVRTSVVLREVELKLMELSYCPSDFDVKYDKKFQKRIVDIIKVFLIEEEDGYLDGYKVETRPEEYRIWEHIDVILTEIDN